MKSLMPALPLLIPFATAIVSLFFGKSPRAQRWVGVMGTSLLLAAALALLVTVHREGILVLHAGNWTAPFGIALVVDLLSAIMVTMAALMGLGVLIFSFGSMDDERIHFGFFPLFQFLLMGVCGAFTTGDLFNLYVWYEVMLMSSFALITLGGTPAQLEGGIKYVVMNLVSSSMFLTALGILYGMTGTLNMADLARFLDHGFPPALSTTLGMLFLIGFGIKAAAFPFFFWLPASYATPPVAVTAIFSALLTKTGVYSLLRVFTLLFTQNVDYTHQLLLVMAGLTMVTGVLGAVAQNEVRRLLSFHIVSQIGYLLMGLGLFSEMALAGTVFFMAHVIIAKSSLFLASGIMSRKRGTYDLQELGGFAKGAPVFAALFLLAALALAGLPPFSGFFAKFALVRAGLSEGHYFITAVALFVSILTLFSMIKIWAQAFWKESPNPVSDRKVSKLLWTPFGALAILTLVMGLCSEPLLRLSLSTARQLLDKQQYIRVVLGANL